MEILDLEPGPFTMRERAVLTVLSNDKFMTVKDVDAATNILERKAKGRQRIELLSDESSGTILKNLKNDGSVLSRERQKATADTDAELEYSLTIRGSQLREQQVLNFDE